MSKVGIVIPTIFERPEYLFEAIESIRTAGDAYILLSSPDNPEMVSQYIHLVDEHALEPPDRNLAGKIDLALNQLPPECEFIGWLGDDDLLTKDSLTRAVDTLRRCPHVGLIYGSCEYIDKDGNRIGKNPSGHWAKRVMYFGPFLIPQPGSLWRRDIYNSIGGLSVDFELAFDHDLFIRLNEISSAHFLPYVQAKFRWHDGSLSVSSRWRSVTEASRIRKSHYPQWFLPISILWEPVIMIATKIAGSLVGLRLKMRRR